LLPTTTTTFMKRTFIKWREAYFLISLETLFAVSGLICNILEIFG
jgi:hypothetical protein